MANPPRELARSYPNLILEIIIARVIYRTIGTVLYFVNEPYKTKVLNLCGTSVAQKEQGRGNKEEGTRKREQERGNKKEGTSKREQARRIPLPFLCSK